MTDEIYKLENVPIFEAMYGTGLISLGGYPAVEQMLTGLNLSKKKLLDVGSGIGGMAHYLAQKYNTHVTGLEIYPWMAEYAAQKSAKNIKNQIDFVIYKPDGTIPLPSEHYDIIYSKGVLTNVSNKPALFTELFRLLKPSGTLCLIDWLTPESQGPKHETLPMGDASYKETKSSYQKILTLCGFTNITFQNKNSEYLEYVKALDARYQSPAHKEKYKNIIDDKLRLELIHSNSYLQKSIESGEQISYLIRAQKKL